jgi:hypothetical protein
MRGVMSAMRPAAKVIGTRQHGLFSPCLWLIMLLVLIGGCTGSAPSPTAQTPGSIRTTSPAPGEAAPLPPGSCPITQPVPHQEVPKAVVAAVDPGHQGPYGEHDFDYWYGNDALWVELPPGSEVIKPLGEQLSEKFPWVRLVRGYLKIEGRRLDGPAGPARVAASTGYGRIGFQASGVAFPTTGCWELTGTIAGGTLTFIVDVSRASA